MIWAKPPLESSRGLFKASFELKYEVFVVFSRTSSISILLFALLLFISSKMFADRFLFKQRNIHCCAICIFNCINISAFYIVQNPFFSWSFSFSCPSISWLFRILPKNVQVFSTCIAALMKICTQATQPRYMMKPNVHVTS